MTTDNRNETIHHGRNVKRFREMLNIKQEGLAISLGDDWNQKKVSLLEQKEVIDDDILEQVAKVLKVPVEAIKNFDAQEAIYNIQNNYEGSNTNATNVGPAAYMNYKCNFNPLDKYLEQVEENKKLYQALLKEKDEKIALLEKMSERK